MEPSATSSSCFANETMNYPLDLQIKFHVEVLLDFCCVVFGVTGLVFYLRRHKHRHSFGTLPFSMVTTILYGVAVGDNYVRQVLSVHGIVVRVPLAYSWRVFVLVYPPNFTYVSGATLALDRVLAMLIPFTHVTHNLSPILTVLGMLVCLSSFLLVCISNAIVPGTLQDAVWDETSLTRKIYVDTTFFYECVFASEVVLHIAFCLLFYRYSRRRRSSVVRQQSHKVLKTNHITLFQICTQTVLCVVPKVFYYTNKLFFGSKIEWILHYYSYYSFFLSINVCVVSFFIVYRFFPRQRSMVIVQNTTLHSNTGKAVANSN
ncbi:hypothetical protein QR680_008884 [Steinernema hermaphroditum]|uniref:Uncharacterized protein n=1 Tax=Steinernema hermaphroditum TaxID=289476 RepID=A0AA39IK56_9BILA|nr:hypothetical protein QR680_008884 [Steinernema hermaphroditum]